MAAIMDWSEAFAQVEAATREAVSAFPLSYTGASPLGVSIQILLVFTFGCWLASVVTDNYSFADRIWSITPFVYAWHFAYRAYLDDGGVWNDRLVLMAALATTWGIRLTFNFARKGGYRLSEEDYRWAVVRSYLHPIAYQLFNVVFIAGYQNVLLYLTALPAYAAFVCRTPSAPLTPLDLVATALFLSLLLLETVADQQQWVFYQTKYARIAKKQPLTGDFKVGFNRSGLFRYSRHPNFFAEQAQWCVFYLFSVAASGVVWNPTVVGAVLLVLLFQGSTAFTEWITVGKYPEYKAYQLTTSRLMPWFPASAKKRVD
jgi:steroid 5-alpha reductase family enzyme